MEIEKTTSFKNNTSYTLDDIKQIMNNNIYELIAFAQSKAEGEEIAIINQRGNLIIQALAFIEVMK